MLYDEIEKTSNEKKLKTKCLGITLKTKFNYENEKKLNNNKKIRIKFDIKIK